MSDLVRLTRTLHHAAREWGRIESDYAEPMITEITANHGHEPVEPYQTAFRVSLFKPALDGSREYTITITASDTRR